MNVGLPGSIRPSIAPKSPRVSITFLWELHGFCHEYLRVTIIAARDLRQIEHSPRY
ncbi:hypothetical protein PISMIDRAFT_681016 [Pisolithus microcarpus 441]|uniref:Uncharacterized protein n=1 Tax=Pisolithus microcarpus 441 TaxID=765257 RepID=A0A0C9YAH2_9AGAM|nr:hypothetical protein PISMIDRAFT_681016 [Pisolithus microcarpus 441]